MQKTLQILIASLKLAFQELYKNKLRTFLSLFGVTIGIFCIIGVLSTVSSLEKNIQDGIKTLGSNTIYIDKWNYQGGPDYPWWKYVNRPSMRMAEAKALKQRMAMPLDIVFNLSVQNKVEYADLALEGINYHGITEAFDRIQPVEILHGRYLNASDFDKDRLRRGRKTLRES